MIYNNKSIVCIKSVVIMVTLFFDNKVYPI